MPITIDTNTDRFFIAICKDGPHSFVMLGSYNGDKVTHLLCRVGKVAALPKKKDRSCFDVCSAIKDTIIDKAPAKVRDEGTDDHDKAQKPISYEAYDITLSQYIEFVRTLELLQTEEKKYQVYKPTKQDGSKVEFVKTSRVHYAPRNDLDRADRCYCELSLGNTCRHGAIKLIESVIKLPQQSMVSSYFFVNLLNNTQLDYGVPSKSIPFYVLPTPPNSYSELNRAQRMVADKLFSRMERLLLIDPYSSITASKFNHLKELYQQIIGAERKPSINELLNNIHDWKRSHRPEIETLRKTYIWDSFFTRKSATMTMIEELEQDLPQLNR
ncbi:hypothetical protein [Legionella waltersii]|uniref:SWIM-type domain-containing protein n=1 Tax=Legionella waltersii TaxID=66969 RepID=A0A0W1AMS4_9GAMM|nr:hypothetical protein [Legionella waltersii]KTD82504.1 hypothetical protein Lwal_0621 [Legionella waltersii]SNV02941.1 Uncharacterised protein [Legionella waltersii]